MTMMFKSVRGQAMKPAPKIAEWKRKQPFKNYPLNGERTMLRSTENAQKKMLTREASEANKPRFCMTSAHDKWSARQVQYVLERVFGMETPHSINLSRGHACVGRAKKLAHEAMEASDA